MTLTVRRLACVASLILLLGGGSLLAVVPTTPPPDQAPLPMDTATPPEETPLPSDTVPPVEEPFEEEFPTETASTTTYFEDDFEDEGAAFCAGCAVLGIAFPLVILGISIAIALWIWRDAKERNIASAPLWAILGFLFNVLGLVIYLIARKNMSGPPPAAQQPPPPPNVPPPSA